MAKNLTVDSADKNSRWFITPGRSSTYDLQVHNDTDRAVLCRVTLASHPDTGSVKPGSLTLQAHETRTVAVTFGPEAVLPRDRKAVIAVKDAAGKELSTIERELVSGASTDATIDLTWKAPIVEDGALRGFTLVCTIHSLSGAADEFTPGFGPHPSLSFPTLSPVWLEPGGTAEVELPIRWDRAARDPEGWNHPRVVEASVAVSQGRRSGRLSWDVVQRHVADMLDRSDRSPQVERKAAVSSSGPVAVAPAAVAPVAVAPAVSPVIAPEPSRDAAKSLPAAAADVNTNFDGYRPPFQLVKGRSTPSAVAQTAAAVRASDASAPAPLETAIGVDDLDSSIVGSGLNYSRSTVTAREIHAVPRRTPLGAWIAGAAVAAVVGVGLLRPHAPAANPATNSQPSTSAESSAVAPAVIAQVKRVNSKRFAAHVAPKPKLAPPSPAAATVAAAPAAVAPQPQVVAHVAAATHRSPAHPAAARPTPIDRSALPSIDSVDASYTRLGRSVRVEWNSTAQSSAAVQLTDARGTLIAQSSVRGGRERQVLSLPRGYHGGVNIQVSVTGFHSERVVQTSSLPPF